MIKIFNNKNIKFGEGRLLFAFGILIALTIAIGASGIFQINELSERIRKLGTTTLKLEQAILEMKINNTVYSMGIRHYVASKVSSFTAAIPSAVNPQTISEAQKDFRQQLKAYEKNSYLPQQKEWIKQLEASFDELCGIGRQIVDLVDARHAGDSPDTIKNLLVVFENRAYKIDKFIDNILGKENISEIEWQIMRTNSDRVRAVSLLSLILISAVTVSSFIAVFVYRHRKKDRLYRHQLLDQMINLEEKERKNLSAEIHDQMGQDLSALKIYMGIIGQNIASMCHSEGSPQGEAKNLTPDTNNKIEECRKIVSSLIEKSHNIAFLLRPPSLDEVGLIESLEALLMDYKHLTGINYIYEKPEDVANLSEENSLLIYRISQELLTNMAKYSKATEVKIRLQKNKNVLWFCYEDNGIGFEYNEVFNRQSRRQEDKFKLGLKGLKERVELLDGLMRVDTSKGKGVRIEVELMV